MNPRKFLSARRKLCPAYSFARRNGIWLACASFILMCVLGLLSYIMISLKLPLILDYMPMSYGVWCTFAYSYHKQTITGWRCSPKLRLALVLIEAIILIASLHTSCQSQSGDLQCAISLCRDRFSSTVPCKTMVLLYHIKVGWLSFDDLSTHRHLRSFCNWSRRRACEVITENAIARSSTAT